MSLFSSVRASFAQGLAKSYLAELLKPYGVALIELDIGENHRLSVHVSGVFPDRRESLEVIARIDFRADGTATLSELGSDWALLNKISPHLLGRDLPLTADQIKHLRKLWA